jgi:UDP-N-acetylglucosamine transferase subunit ALG13
VATLLVSSVGGHLVELSHWASRLVGDGEDRVWVTFDTPQSRSLLAGEQVIYLAYTGPRDWRNVLRHVLVARRMFRGRHPFSAVISAGSGIALSFLPLARARGASCTYIESATRSTGPSTTGRLLARWPGIKLYTQYPGWADRRWRYAGSVFDAFAPGQATQPPAEIRSAVVTLGTMEDYPFRRLLEKARDILPRDAAVLWQVGCTSAAGLDIDARRYVAPQELDRGICAADVIIAHAGCGSALAALAAGKRPILVPRRQAHGENVDDHQLLIAEELERRGLAVVRSVEGLTPSALTLAASATVGRGLAP